MEALPPEASAPPTCAPYREPPQDASVPVPTQRPWALIATFVVASLALVIAFGALHVASTVLGLASLRPALHGRARPPRPEAQLDTAVRELAERRHRPLFIAPGVDARAVRLRIDVASLDGPFEETVHALDEYAATRRLWFHELDGVLRLEREVNEADVDCDGTLDECTRRLERVASVEVHPAAEVAGRPVRLHVHRGAPVVEATRAALTAAGFQVDVVGRALYVSGGLAVSAGSTEREGDDARTGGIYPVGRGRYLISRRALERMLSHPQTLMRSARIIPETRSGRVVGVRVFGLRAEELPARLGVLNGDVILRVNGLDVASPDRCLEAYVRLRSAEQVTLELERRGRVIALEYLFV